MIVNDSDKVKTELLKIGIKVKDIYDLVNSSEKYPDAIPVLIDLLQNVTDL